MIIATPVTPDGQVDHSWGKAPRVAITDIEDGVVQSWDEHEVGWDVLHDEGAHGSHHARIVKFLRENNVDAVIINHCGAPMLNTMQKMGLIIALDAEGPARDVALNTSPKIQDILNMEAGGGCCGGGEAGGCGCGGGAADELPELELEPAGAGGCGCGGGGCGCGGH
ncbi:NifB/NifX family molybdenum-iron cluster-binding protein [Ancrocorticia populi]|uniref:NifB/NifX family molybdenum-iron cluster-binding protein n=2 Tax=Ancrocorticia populi TaxID=2175228 RepID=UPI001A9C393E|nr:NifB/NifX family molybdenum-iron cluster-binding protein [Ancrocorticia populi]